MSRITFIAQFPPPIHGLSKAVETLYYSPIKKKYDFRAIDITNNKKLLFTLWKILMSKTDVFYFTLSQTRGGNWRDLLFLKIIAWRKKKCIVHLHGGYYRKLIEEHCGRWQRNLNYKFIGGVRAAIVLGNSLRSIFKDLLPEERIHVVPNCVDNQYMAKDIDDKIRRQESEPRLHVLYLSNFIETKGYKDVLALGQKAKTKNNALHFEFAGKFFDKADENFFYDFIKEHHLEDFVTYHGIVSGDSKNELLHKCSFFILPTRYPNEGQPISILEAMGNGMTVITTNHAGIPDIATMENGYVCDKNNIDIDGMLRSIIDYADDRKRLNAICLRNFEIAKSRYLETEYINNMDKIFERVCNE